jgi:proline iminopeptidase
MKVIPNDLTQKPTILSMKLKLSLFLLSVTLFLFTLEGCQTKELRPGEGYIDVTGGKVWYRIYGEGNKTPILLLHGGPGSSSYGLTPLKALSKDRPVIFYDQLGCGRSTRITDTTLMTIDRYVEELEQIRKALNLKDFYLYGQSWGPALGLDYYLKYPNEVKAIIFSSPLFSTDLWIKDADTLIATLPDSIQLIIRENEKNKTFDNEAYQSAVDYYYSKFLWRTGQTQSQADSGNLFSGTNVYEFMWGPSEFTATGNLLHYDRVDRLKEVAVPTLLMTGEYDEARPNTVNYFHSLIPGSEFTVIKNSGHATVHDNPKETIARINEFLKKHDD